MTHVLRPGDRGPRVLAVRVRLAELGVPTRDDDQQDVFDPGLERAVRGFQQTRGLVADGLVGPDTARELEAARWRLGDRILRFVPGHLQHGDDVQQLQRELARLGVLAGRADGLFGPDTERGVRELQRGVGLVPDGTCGPDTLRALARLSRSVSGGNVAALREGERLRATGPSLVGRVVVIDPGHGGDDTGVTGHGLAEADVVLDVARRLEGRLAATGVTAVLTRGELQDPSNSERAALARRVSADVVVSLHCDRDERGRGEGVATHYWGGRDALSASPTGQRLAELVQREVVARTGLVDCRAHPRTWELLQVTSMPAVWVELGYLSHPGDAERLGSPAFRDTCAEGLLAAVQRLFLPEQQDWSTGSLHLDDVLAMVDASART
ncbi:N-acetylmuramoyl-L-alanine amidase [Angustibacter speluncae]